MTNYIVPPGGPQGFNQMTPASQRALFPRGGGTGGRRRRKTAKKKATRRAGKRAGARKLKFGTPAWQKKYRVGKFAKKK